MSKQNLIMKFFNKNFACDYIDIETKTKTIKLSI